MVLLIVVERMLLWVLQMGRRCAASGCVDAAATADVLLVVVVPKPPLLLMGCRR